MKVVALGLVGAIFGADGLARAQQEPQSALGVVDHASVQDAQGAVVHVEASDQGARVQALDPLDQWITVCQVPCDQPLDPRPEYRVSGRGLRPTNRFRVPPQGHLLLRADMKPTRNIVFGATFASVGALFLLTGGVTFALGTAERTNASNDPAPDIAQRERDAASLLSDLGVVFALAGVVMLIPGFIFLESGTKSTLHTEAYTALRRSNLRIIPGGFAF